MNIDNRTIVLQVLYASTRALKVLKFNELSHSSQVSSANYEKERSIFFVDDSLTGNTIRKILVPAFRKGRFARRGLRNGMDAFRNIGFGGTLLQYLSWIRVARRPE